MASKTTYELQLKLGASASQSWKRTLRDAQSSLEDFNSLSNKIMTGAAAGVTATVGTIAYAATQALDTYKSFEQEMATVGSISGATALQFEDMKNAAMDAGRVTTFTATESASALEYMSLAGWSSEQAIAGLVPMLRLAASTGADLQTTSDLVTDSMSALGLGVDELDMYLDKLINTNNNANTTAEMLMESLVKTGGASRVLGASLDDTITALGILANNGVKAEEAGTALNAIMVRLAGNDTAIKQMSELNIDIWKDDGSFIGFENALIRINAAMSELTDEDRAAALKNIAGTHHYSQMSYLLDAVNQISEDQATAWDMLEEDVAKSSGALDRMYAVTTDTFLNAEKRLESAKEDMQLRFADVIADETKDFVLWLADNLPEATDALVDFAQAHKGEFAKALKGATQLIESTWEKALDAGEWIIDHKTSIKYSLSTIAAGIGLIKTATIGLSIAKFLSNPLSAAATAAGLAAVGIASVAGAIEDARIAAMNANLDSHFGNIALSLSEIQSVAKHIISSDEIDAVVNSLQKFEGLDEIYDSIQENLEDIQKYNWKVSIGMELTADEEEIYKKTIDEFVENAKEYALQTEYAVAVQMSLSFTGENSNIADRVNEFYGNQYSKLTRLGTDLKDAVTNAFNDGLLQVDEIATITNLQNQMADIEKKLAVGEFEANLNLLGLDYTGKELTAESFAQLQEELASQTEEVKASYREAYKKQYAAITNTYNEGYLTKGEYTEAIRKIQQDFNNEISAIEMKALQFEMDTVTTTYADEISQYAQVIDEALEKYNDTDDPTNNWNDYGWEMLEKTARYVQNHETDSATQDAITSLLDGMSVPLEAVYKLKDKWDALTPELKSAVSEIMESVDTLKAVSNYQDYNLTDDGRQKLISDINLATKESDYQGTSEWLDTYLLGDYQNKNTDSKLREISIKLEDTNDTYGITDYQDKLENVLGTYNDSPGYQTEWRTYPEKVFDAILGELSMTAEDYEGIHKVLEGLEDPIQEVYALQEEWDELNPATQKLVTSIINSYENLSKISGYGQLNDEFKTDNLTNIIKDIVDAVSGSEDYQNIKAFIDTYYNGTDYQYLIGEADGTKLFQYRKSDDKTYDAITNYINGAAKEASQAIDDARDNVINPAVDAAYDSTDDYINRVFAKGFSTSSLLTLILNTKINGTTISDVMSEQPSRIESDVSVIQKADVTTEYLPYLKRTSSLLDDVGGLTSGNILSNAKGGIYTSPILTTFAEEGPEAALPLDGSDRAKSLWIKAGQLLGVVDDAKYISRSRRLLDGMSEIPSTNREQSEKQQIVVTYNPQITIEGNANKEEVNQALSLSLSELKMMLKEIERENGRVTFA